MIAMFALGIIAIFLGPHVLGWLPTAGHLLISAGIFLAATLFALRSAGQLGWYPTRTRLISGLGSASAAVFAALNLVIFVGPDLAPKAGRSALLAALLIVGLVFFGSLVPDLVSRRK